MSFTIDSSYGSPSPQVSPRRQKFHEQNQLRNHTRQQQSEIKRMTFGQARYNAAMARWNQHLARLQKHGRAMGFNVSFFFIFNSKKDFFHTFYLYSGLLTDSFLIFLIFLRTKKYKR